MVDLVKIRKKAKKKKEDDAAATAAEQAPESTPSLSAEEPQKDAKAPPAPVGEADTHGDATNRGASGSKRDSTAPAGPSKLERFKQQAGKRREFQAERVEESEAEDRLELLTFIIAGEQYAADIEKIVEIITPRTVTRVPNADESVVGIMSLRGTIVTLVDVRGKLRHSPAGEAGPETRIIVVEMDQETVGFVVDRVLRVVKVDRGSLEPHPVVHATELDESIRGVFTAGNALTILLDLEKLLVLA